MSNTDGQDGYAGQRGLNSATSMFNAINFIVQQGLGTTNTIKVVQVKKVTNEGGVSPVGFVNVQIMTNLMNGVGDSTEHGIIFNVPYFRVQGGRNAIIIDPEVDDIGLMVVADRDISAVKEAKKLANPGSMRRFSLADGIYIGGILNAAPEQYVRFTEDGIEIKDTHGNVVTMDDDGIEVLAEIGNVTVKRGDVVLETSETRIRSTVGSAIFNVSSDGVDVSGVPLRVYDGLQMVGPVTGIGGGVWDTNLTIGGIFQAASEIIAYYSGPSFVRLAAHSHPANNSPPTPGT